VHFSKSGKPFTTPNGHLPAWTEKVEWHSASALDPEDYRSLISSSNTVVHTLGTLLETEAYKRSVKSDDPLGVAVAGVKALRDNLQGENPLNKGSKGSYWNVNRDTGAYMCLF
jgi:hypothetical protein